MNCGPGAGDLAEALQLSRQTVDALERHRCDPSLPLALRLAQLFDLPDRGYLAAPKRRRPGFRPGRAPYFQIGAWRFTSL